jgi:hypothetical protein
LGKRKVVIEIDDKLVNEYFEGLDGVNDSDARTAVQEIFDAGLGDVGISSDYGSDAYRRVSCSGVLDGDGTESTPLTVGNDSGAGSRGLEQCKCGFRAPELGPHPDCRVHAVPNKYSPHSKGPIIEL